VITALDSGHVDGGGLTDIGLSLGAHQRRLGLLFYAASAPWPAVRHVIIRFDPPELARLGLSGLPSLSDHLMVVRVGEPSDNELRIMRPSAISGTKARVTSDDDFVTSHYDE